MKKQLLTCIWCCITNKILRDGQLLIIRGDKTYTITGQLIK